MRRVFRFLARRWLVTLIGLLALSLLIWFVGPLVSIAEYTPLAGVLERIIGILVVFLLWALNRLRRHMLARRADKKLVNGLAEAESQSVVDANDQASTEEVAQLSERFEEAIALLRKAGRKRGMRSLYELPWYILVGPPGSGKTTILRNSGLDFPLADHLGNEALKGIGGTRNCDWWITNEAVLIDTAGRYTTQDSDQQVDKSAWEGFLDLLKKYRRRRPINGVLIAISLSDLMTQSEHERFLHARAIKQRLQELYRRLGMRFPVYVMFTKADLIAGFGDFFEDMGREEREQVWGATFPFDEVHEPLENAATEFGLLVQRLNDRLLWRLNQERDIERRARILNFPRQFASIGPPLLRFLDEVFRSSRFDEIPLLRGIYFTSGTQEGTPVDRLMGQLGRAFGLHPDAASVAPRGHGKSYFVTSLLKRVVFPERDLAGIDHKLERRRIWLHRTAYVGAAVALVIGLFAWITSYTGNSNYLREIGEGAGKVETWVAKPVPGDADFSDIAAELDEAATLVRTAARHEDDTPWSMRFGLYQGGMIAREASNAYARLLNGLLLPKIANRLEQQLASGVSDSDFRYEALKLYLMLGNLDRLDPDLLKDWMLIDWESRYPGDAKLRGHLQEHLAALIELGIKPTKLNPELIERQRAYLKQVPLAELVYGRLKREYLADDNMPFRITDAAGQNASRVFVRSSGKKLDEPAIPGLFTYRGFYEVYGKESLRLVQQFQREAWVLGGENEDEGMTQQELKQLENDLRSLYLDDYVKVWSELLADLRIVPLRSVSHATEVLDLLAGSTSPMERLLKGVERNTTLGRLPPGADKLADIAGEALKRRSRLARIAGQTAQAGALDEVKKPGDQVDDYFERLNVVVRGEKGGSPPIKRITAIVSDVYGYISTLQGGSLEEALEAAKGGNDGIKTMQKLRILAARQPEPVKTWLSQLFRSTRSVTLGGARRELSKKWKTSVVPVCNKALLQRYPFRSGSEAEATLRDFGRFFGEGGVMDRFFQEQLAQFVDTSRSPWRWRKGAGKSMGMSQKVLRQFQRAAEIKEAFFQDGGQLPHVNFTLKPVYLAPGVDKFLLDLEGQTFLYRHGPEVAKKADWPGPERANGIRLVFEKGGKTVESLRKEGPWAWFRLLEESDVEKLGDDKLLITFDVNGVKARYELRADSVYNPFELDELHGFRCPGGL